MKTASKTIDSAPIYTYCVCRQCYTTWITEFSRVCYSTSLFNKMNGKIIRKSRRLTDCNLIDTS